VIIGTDSAEGRQALEDLYAPFVRTGNPLIVMDIPSAEMTKYAANAMLATRISFMNQIAVLCEAVGADVSSVRHGIGTDRRIGSAFLFPGPGYGGSCFPKDVKALIRTASDAGVPIDIIEAVEEANERQKRLLAAKLRSHLGDLRGRAIAVWGLAFKPNTDDMREAPSRTLIADLLAAGAAVCAYDPVAGGEARRLYARDKDVQIVDSALAALEGCDALAIVTEWQEFRSPDFAEIRRRLKVPAIFDGRNLYEPAVLRAYGMEYFPIGRPT